ncbi:hypothetical protein [Halosolutus gelatinilyticus]|uniref:hypothetical protein n=1 Tax=Halosolutus gelatinilyticus TaxID=2931975 RepID=UPI001FF10236|nr:hypothetical protein [Halosolutus gelatinilyticus]
MNTQRLQTRRESTPNRTANRSPSTVRPTPPAELVRSPTDRAPKTFAQNTRRLQNLVDEFNAAFAASQGDR